MLHLQESGASNNQLFKKIEANELANYELHSCARGAKFKKLVKKCLISAKNMSRDDKPLIVSLSSLPGDIFAKKILTILCMLKTSNEIKTTTLLDTGATRYSFIDPSMVRYVCDKMQIEFIRLSKPKAI